MNIQFTDHSDEVRETLRTAAVRALEKCGLTAEGHAKKFTPVDTGTLRNSIAHKVDEDEQAVYVGANSEYAAYVELGTGIHYPGGRQMPWVYEDAKGNRHMTRGQRAHPSLKPAVADHQRVYKGIIEDELKGK